MLRGELQIRVGSIILRRHMLDESIRDMENLSIDPLSSEEERMEQILNRVWDLKNSMVDFNKMLCWVFKVSKVSLNEDRITTLDISCMETHLDDLESGYQVKVGEVEDICHRL